MRKLLVASQKGGVGKTTTSINLAAATARAGARVLLLDADPLSPVSASLGLAEHANRQPLRGNGLELPGVLVADVLPGLDVLCPYEGSGCSDDEMDALLAVLAAPDFRACYDNLIVDTPPFLGPNPAQLLLACDELVLVMRAETMAARTLPAFLQLVQRSNRAIKMRGIVLTMAQGDEPGGRMEREMRGRFGTRIFPQVVPHDEAVGEAHQFSQVVSDVAPHAPAAQAYQSVVAALRLAEGVAEAPPGRASGIAALLLGAASAGPPAAKRASGSVKRPSRSVKRASGSVKRPVVAEEPVTVPASVGASVAAFGPLDDEPPGYDQFPEPVRRRLTPAIPVPAVASISTEALAAEAPSVKEQSPPRKAAPRPQRGANSIGMGLLWVASAVAVGASLRFLHLPQTSVPVLVGVGVALAVALVLRTPQKTAREAAPSSAGRRGARATPKSVRRLSDLARRVKMPAGKGRGGAESG